MGKAKQGGYSTAPDHSLNVDVILAAQTQLLSSDVVIATDNVRHLSRFANAARWTDISIE